MWTFYFRSLLWSSHERRDYKTGVEAKLSQKSILNQKEQFCDLGQFMQYFIEWIKTFFFFLVHPHPQHNEKVHFAKSFPTFGLSSPKQTQNKKNFFCTTFREHSKQIENFPRSSSAASDKIVLLIFFCSFLCYKNTFSPPQLWIGTTICFELVIYKKNFVNISRLGWGWRRRIAKIWGWSGGLFSAQICLTFFDIWLSRFWRDSTVNVNGSVLSI